MTVCWWFGREVRVAGSVFNSFLDFNGYALKLSGPYFSTSVFLVQVMGISNITGFSSNSGRASLFIWWPIYFFDALTCGLAPSSKLQIGIIIFYTFQFQNYFEVWHCDKLRLRPWRHGELTLTFLYVVYPTWEQKVDSSKCSTVPGLSDGGSDKTDQDFKVGILNED